MKNCVNSSADWGTASTGPKVSWRREDPTLPFLPSIVKVIRALKLWSDTAWLRQEAMEGQSGQHGC